MRCLLPAIIGGGIGGTSCAFFLKSLFTDEDVDIELFEAEKIGGRLSVTQMSEKYFEEGGSVIHHSNKYMKNFREKFGLKERATSESYTGLYDGKKFVFSESRWHLISYWRLLWRYGLGIWKLKKLTSDMVKKFSRIYELQDSGIAFETVGSLLAAIDPKFEEYLHTSTRLSFESQGISKTVVNEIVLSSTRANYGQDLNIQSMVGSVSVVGCLGNLWSTRGGNFRIAKNLLRASGATLVNGAVTSVERTAEGVFFIKSTPGFGNGEVECGPYDAVVVATPQTSDVRYRIRFENFEEEIRFPGRYHQTVCTFVDGCLSSKYFPNKDAVVDEILTTKKDVPFDFIGKLYPLTRSTKKQKQCGVWKIFTENEMSRTQIGQIFSEVRKIHVKKWLAYPQYDDFSRNDSFVLAPNLYHINAIEWVASAMEMSVIGARNVALLVHKCLTENQSSRPTVPDSPEPAPNRAGRFRLSSVLRKCLRYS